MKTLNVMIQNSKGKTSAELQLSFLYGVDLISETIAGLTLAQGDFNNRDLNELSVWLGETIVKLEDGDLIDTNYTIVNRKVRLYTN